MDFRLTAWAILAKVPLAHGNRMNRSTLLPFSGLVLSLATLVPTVARAQGPAAIPAQSVTPTCIDAPGPDVCCEASDYVIEGSDAPDFEVAARCNWVVGTSGFARCVPIDGCVIGYENSDVLIGLVGDTFVHGDTGGDLLLTGAGRDAVVGGFEADYISVSAGDDEIHPGPGLDVVRGGTGDDVAFLGGGADDVRMGPGSDVVVVRNPCEVPTGTRINGGLGDDTLVSPLTVAELTSAGVIVEGFEFFVLSTDQYCESECAPAGCGLPPSVFDDPVLPEFPEDVSVCGNDSPISVQVSICPNAIEPVLGRKVIDSDGNETYEPCPFSFDDAPADATGQCEIIGIEERSGLAPAWCLGDGQITDINDPFDLSTSGPDPDPDTQLLDPSLATYRVVDWCIEVPTGPAPDPTDLSNPAGFNPTRIFVPVGSGVEPPRFAWTACEAIPQTEICDREDYVPPGAVPEGSSCMNNDDCAADQQCIRPAVVDTDNCESPETCLISQPLDPGTCQSCVQFVECPDPSVNEKPDDPDFEADRQPLFDADPQDEGPTASGNTISQSESPCFGNSCRASETIFSEGAGTASDQFGITPCSWEETTEALKVPAEFGQGDADGTNSNPPPSEGGGYDWSHEKGNDRFGIRFAAGAGQKAELDTYFSDGGDWGAEARAYFDITARAFGYEQEIFGTEAGGGFDECSFDFGFDARLVGKTIQLPGNNPAKLEVDSDDALSGLTNAPYFSGIQGNSFSAKCRNLKEKVTEVRERVNSRKYTLQAAIDAYEVLGETPINKFVTTPPSPGDVIGLPPPGSVSAADVFDYTELAEIAARAPFYNAVIADLQALDGDIGNNSAPELSFDATAQSELLQAYNDAVIEYRDTTTALNRALSEGLQTVCQQAGTSCSLANDPVDKPITFVDVGISYPIGPFSVNLGIMGSANFGLEWATGVYFDTQLVSNGEDVVVDPSAGISAGITPSIGAEVLAALSFGIGNAVLGFDAGILIGLNLITLEFPIEATMGISRESTFKAPNNRFEAPQMKSKWGYEWTFGISVVVKALDGYMDLFVRARILGLSKQWKKTIADWKGIRKEIPIFTKGNGQPADSDGDIGESMGSTSLAALTFDGVNPQREGATAPSLITDAYVTLKVLEEKREILRDAEARQNDQDPSNDPTDTEFKKALNDYTEARNDYGAVVAQISAAYRVLRAPSVPVDTYLPELQDSAGITKDPRCGFEPPPPVIVSVP